MRRSARRSWGGKLAISTGVHSGGTADAGLRVPGADADRFFSPRDMVMGHVVAVGEGVKRLEFAKLRWSGIEVLRGWLRNILRVWCLGTKAR